MNEMLPKKKTNIDEWFNLLRDIVLLRKNQLVASYSLLKVDVNRPFWFPALTNCKHVYKPVVSFIKKRICQYVNTTDRIIIDQYIAI
jgi:hypothetical protein